MVPSGRLELPLPASEADALSTELRGQENKFYHIWKNNREMTVILSHLSYISI
jgi:hypothetical protein